jgi:parvulin-like peptidyl-prolyl isomerase
MMKLGGRIIAIALVGALAVGLTACGNKDVAAKVNGVVITNTEVNQQLTSIKNAYPQMFTGADAKAREADLRKRILDNLINTELVTQAAKARGISVTDAEVKKTVDEIKKSVGNEKAYQDALKKANLTEAKLIDQQRKQMLIQKLTTSLTKNIKVTDKDIQDYYAKNKTQFEQKAANRVAHILFGPNDKTKAENALVQLKAGADFAAMAKKDSIDKASAAQGGDLGWPTSPFVAEFQAAADKLKIKGQLSPLVKTVYGYHIIKLLDHRTASVQSIASVRTKIIDLIKQQRQAQAYTDFLAKVKKQAKIEISKTAQTAVSSTPATSTGK